MGIATSVINKSVGIFTKTIQFFTTDAVAAADTVFAFGFKPRAVRFINLTDRVQDEWFEGMPNGYALHTVAAGTVTYVTTGGITINADGNVSIPAALMTASKSFVVVAEA